MTPEQITEIAREYAEDVVKTFRNAFGDLPDCAYDDTRDTSKDNAEDVIRFLLRRYCLVEKSKLEELDIAFRAKHYGIVVLNQGDIERLFPEIAKEVEE